MSKDVIRMLFWSVVLGILLFVWLMFAYNSPEPPANQFGNGPEECARQYRSLSPEEKAWWNGSEDYINACVQ